MIWTAAPDNEQKLFDLSDRLAKMLAREFADARIDGVVLHELAQGVLRYCTKTVGARHIPADYLTLLVARALWALGMEDIARDYLYRRFPKPLLRDALRVLSMGVTWKPPFWEIFASRVIRSSDLLSAESENAWIVDFKRMVREASMDMELVSTQVARHTIDSLAPVWDSSAGSGSLSITGVTTRPASFKPGVNAARLCASCQDVLQKAARDRAWNSVPRVLLLNL